MSNMMEQLNLPVVGDGSGLESDGRLHPEELQLAFRNNAIPLEGLRYDVTPTGMHYTLIHYDVPSVDRGAWRLAIAGRVGRPLSLTLAELQRRPARTLRVTLECAGDGRALLSPRPLSQPWLTGAVGTAEWTGTPLAPLLREAGLQDDVQDVVFTGLDRGIEGGVEQDYQRALSLEERVAGGRAPGLGDEWIPWSRQHGYPVPPAGARLVRHGPREVAALSGSLGRALQWLPAHGVAHRYRQSRSEPGEPVTLMRVRSLMVPPGIPDFLTRLRVVQQGPVELQGRAWSGRSTITDVEVSADGGATWGPAELEAAVHPHGWQGWRFRWDASRPGMYELCCRARDASGAVQPVEAHWTARGMGNNMAASGKGASGLGTTGTLSQPLSRREREQGARPLLAAGGRPALSLRRRTCSGRLAQHR